jgi:hypothetical protein
VLVRVQSRLKGPHLTASLNRPLQELKPQIGALLKRAQSCLTKGLKTDDIGPP